MDSATAGPCPECREPIDLEARVCPHCRSSVLVDVVLQAALADGRRRYGVAKAVSALGGGAPSVPTLQARLQSGRGAVLEGVTRAVAAGAAEALRAAGVAHAIRRGGARGSAAPRRAGSGLWIGLASALLVTAVGAGLVVSRCGSRAQSPSSSAALALSPTEVAARGLAATVALKCGQQAGSGFFVAKDLLLTNAHVLCANQSTVTIRFSDGREVEGTVRGSDEVLDLAVVQAPGLTGQPLPLGDAGGLQVGERLTMIGSPLGLDFTVHACGVSNLERNEMGVAYVQIDAAVNPGNSGGPLIDDRGRAVGVVTLKLTSGEGIGLAVPVNYAYAGPSALVPGANRPETPAFARMRARAEAANQRDVDDLAAAGQRPGLVGAAVSGNALLAQIVWPSATAPTERSFHFALMAGDRRICAMDGEVQDWQKLEREGASVLPPRVKAWLERNGFASDVYGGSAVLNWAHCADEELGGAVDLELEGADPDASRIRFTS